MVALVNDASLIGLIGPMGIDAYVNPRATTVSSILRYVRRANLIGRAEYLTLRADPRRQTVAGYYVRSAILVGSIPLMAERGGDAAELARALGIDSAALTDPDIPVPAVLVLDFYERAARLVDCPTFGLRMAALTGMAVVGPLWILLRQARTLEEMVEDLATHFELYTRAAIVGLRPVGRDRLLTWGMAGGIVQAEVQMAEYALSVTLAEIRAHGPRGWTPPSVRFRHEAPEDLRLHRQVRELERRADVLREVAPGVDRRQDVVALADETGHVVGGVEELDLAEALAAGVAGLG